ncbi:hypothetical protein OB955_05145 [Halobacteria archaeon AArc-m2/3/4]|uniref:Uncharacterized protein n=1 Tax=Natronoglomus mannanivorans TaxID=2979990 RepID=A0ABT2QB21_9EURY|nr:hypothetical protein [Halobacteria archaeon AArc-m2/3/4]
MWQDFVFLIGSSLSIVFLAPTLRDSSARVPLGTSLPSMGIGAVYAFTFASLGMTFSAMGSLSAATMWSLIALYRSPGSQSPTLTRRERYSLFAADVRRWCQALVTGTATVEQYERRHAPRREHSLSAHAHTHTHTAD